MVQRRHLLKTSLRKLRLCGLRRAWHRRLGQRRSRRRPDSDPSTEPARAARQIVDQGFTPRYDYALQTLRENFYDKWRDYDAEDTLRFYALRLQEVGPIKSSRRRSWPTEPIGASSTSSNAS